MKGINGLQLEFKNHQCLFRLPKAIYKEEGVQLCSIELSPYKILKNK
jgi:hypothetical protein